MRFQKRQLCAALDSGVAVTEVFDLVKRAKVRSYFPGESLLK